MRDNWKIVQFEKLGHTFGGLTNKSADDFGEGKPYIPYLNIFENGKIDPDYLEYVKIKPSERQNKVQFGDLFFTTSSETPHEVGMTSVLLNDLGEAYLNSFCFGFRLQNFEDLSPEFAAYLFRGNEVRKTISDLAQGSTRYNLSKSILFDKLYLNLPPLPQQRKIAKILSTCDRVIAKTEEAIAKYQAIKQGMMHDLFTRGIDLSTGKLRPKYQDAPELFKESELGMIPKDWEVKRLEDISIKIGDGIHTTPRYTNNSNYYFINGNNLENGRIKITKNTNCVNESEYKKHFKDLGTYTILYSINGTIGNIAFYNGETVVLGKSAAYITFKDESTLNYVYFILLTEYVSKFYSLELTGSTISNLSLAAIRNTPILLPKKNELEEITRRLKSFNLKVEYEENTLGKYHKIKSGLIQDLLSGKVEVSVSKEEEIINA